MLLGDYLRAYSKGEQVVAHFDLHVVGRNLPESNQPTCDARQT
jgi:hypothetical protein